MSREFVSDFIKIYEKEPCLWQINCKDYYDENKKEAAYTKLIEKLREIQPNSTKDSVIGKIHDIVSAFRIEKKKMNEFIKSAASSHSVYKPELWYFSMLSFLDDKGAPRPSSTENETTCETINKGVKEQDKAIKISEKGSSNRTLENTTSQTFPVSPRKRNRASDETSEANDNCKRCCTREDRFDVICKSFSMKLRDLPKNQMLIAERLMNEILFQAEMSNLTLSHKLVEGDNFQHTPKYRPSQTTTSTLFSTPPPGPNLFRLNQSPFNFSNQNPFNNRVC